MQLNYSAILLYQKMWQESTNLSDEQKKGFLDLSEKLIQRSRENPNKLEEVTLLYPKDCSDFDIFSDFAFAMNAFFSPREDAGAKMFGWALNYCVDVE